MTTITIDTHELVKTLTARGFTEEQAEGVTHAIKSIDVSHLATKQDLRELEYRLTIKIGTVVFGVLAFFKAMEVFMGL
jgi:hypothetical protein